VVVDPEDERSDHSDQEKRVTAQRAFGEEKNRDNGTWNDHAVHEGLLPPVQHYAESLMCVIVREQDDRVYDDHYDREISQHHFLLPNGQRFSRRRRGRPSRDFLIWPRAFVGCRRLLGRRLARPRRASALSLTNRDVVSV
jgi:hypothetical protein